MKTIFTVILLISFSHSIQAQKGKLGSLNPCKCVDLSEVTNKKTPADILIGMRECIELKEFEKAAQLFAIAGVYGKYDTYRVKDKTAHQVTSILQEIILFDVDEKVKEDLVVNLQKYLKADSEELNNVCSQIQQIGAPKYYPRYMVQHGIQAFTNSEKNSLVKNFKSKESFDLALKEYLHCEK